MSFTISQTVAKVGPNIDYINRTFVRMPEYFIIICLTTIYQCSKYEPNVDKRDVFIQAEKNWKPHYDAVNINLSAKWWRDGNHFEIYDKSHAVCTT